MTTTLRRNQGADQKPCGRSARQRKVHGADVGVVGGLHNIGDGGRKTRRRGDDEMAHPGVLEFCRIIHAICAPVEEGRTA